ncbi:MAG: deoxyguanosinetriphosphate triphosphohydrolase [Acidobacteriota bacterium]
MGLAAYAVRDQDSGGRRHPEPPHPYRTEFQRDRDRVIHTRAFRRLEKKTQVFAPDYSDHFRNRLTHTLEVAQISRTIAESLALNSDLTETLALSHDIGHPPFSHAGEKVLDELMRQRGSGFDHNLHALRIVEDFEEKYPGFRGLNLTLEVREGIIKHSRDYRADETTYVDITEYRPGQRPPLEAQIVDLADEIAYNSADLDDGYASGLLDVGAMRSEMQLFRELWDEVEAEFPEAPEKLKVSEVIRRTINCLTTNLIDSTRARLERLGIRSVDEVRAHPHRLVGFDAGHLDWNAEIKRFLRAVLYDHAVLRAGRERAQRQLEELFHYYESSPERLPPSHQARIDELGVARVVCDYIAGMTDGYAQACHRAIRGE